MPVLGSQGTCLECGGGLPPGAVACPSCGEAAGPHPAESCPACAASIPPEAERCGACGAALAGEGTAAMSPAVPRSTNEYRTLAVVYEGQLGEALQLQQLLAAVRIEGFVPALDERLVRGGESVADFVTVQLMVRRAAEPVAAAAIAEWRRGTRAMARDQAPDPAAELARLGQRIRKTFLVAPFLALWLGSGYVRRCRALPRRPEGHRYTLAALVMAAVVLLVGAAILSVLFGAFA